MLRTTVTALLAIVLLAATGWAQTPAQSPTVAPNTTQANHFTNPDQVPRITPADLKEKMDKNEVIVVDVRNLQYPSMKIKGALNIPFIDLEKNLDKLPKNKLIVTVCS